MTKYSLPNLRHHWAINCADFHKRQKQCSDLLEEIAEVGSFVASLLAQRKALEINCSYLLLVKSLNHCYGTFVLLERGLLIDAALTCRNAIETLLLLELLVKCPELSAKWAAGHEFKPVDVRQQLSSLSEVLIGDLVIQVSPDEYEDTRFAYGIFSRITHANLDSLNHTVTAEDGNSFKLHIGGAHSLAWSKAISGALGSAFLRAAITAVAAHAPAEFEQCQDAFKRLQTKLSDVLLKKDAQQAAATDATPRRG